MGKIDKRRLTLLGAAHFLVDLTCTALLTATAGTLSYWQVTACAVLYNGLAFAFQLPVGALADGMNRKRALTVLGCLLVAAGGLVPGWIPMCLVIGLGNACFHIGGGREILRRDGGRAGMVGRFVAPGAIGIFLGPRLTAFSRLIRGVLPCCLLAAAVLLWRQDAGEEEPAPTGISGAGRLWAACGCMFLTVLLRSYMGTVLTYPFLSKTAAAFGYTLCIFGGKYLGGVLADRFGWVRSCAVTQIPGAVLMTLSPLVPALAFPGIFLFNTTMAVTAAGLYRCVPRFPGTMFGLTTFALYLGVLPRLLGMPGPDVTPWSLGLMSLVSAALLLSGVILMRGGGGLGGDHCDIPGEIPGADPGC